jgi:hypothetical protein
MQMIHNPVRVPMVDRNDEQLLVVNCQVEDEASWTRLQLSLVFDIGIGTSKRQQKHVLHLVIWQPIRNPFFTTTPGSGPCKKPPFIKIEATVT